MGCVCPGARVNEIGAPTNLKGDPGAKGATVPDSIPLPVFFRFTVLVAVEPDLVASATLPGADSFPAWTVPLMGMLTCKCFGSPLLIARVWLTVPITFGVKMMVTGTLIPGGKE